MRKVNIILLLIFLYAEAGSQWFPQSSGTIYALKSVFFTSETTGFACGYNTVLKTTNAGVNWNSTMLNGSHNCIVFTGSQTGYISSNDGKIFKTTDAGGNWVQLNSGVSSHLTSINFLNADTGIACGFDKTILKTTNGGTNWVNIANFVWQVNFLNARMINSSTFFVSGQNTFIMRTTNGGQSWIEHTHGDPNPLFGLSFINSSTGFSTGCCGMFLRTTDGGNNWVNENYLSLGFTFYSIQFINQQTGYMVGDNGMIYRTQNGRQWWDSTVTNTYQSIYSIHMVNQNTGWVVGGYGTILKTTNGGGEGHTIGLNQISTRIPSKFVLSQNYPNPFNPETKILFSIPKSGIVNLTVYNSLGKEVRVLVNRLLNSGTYEFVFSGDNLPSGVYFYRLLSENESATKKMLLVK